MEKLYFTIRWDALQYLMKNVLKKTLKIQPQEPFKDASHILSLPLLQVPLNSCCIHTAEWMSYSSLFPLLQQTSLCGWAKIGLPMPLHACKSHHETCDSSYEVTPATNHILLTWTPVHGRDGALESGSLPIMAYLGIKTKLNEKKNGSFEISVFWWISFYCIDYIFQTFPRLKKLDHNAKSILILIF